MSPHTPQIALMIDADNISSKSIRHVFEKIQTKGKVLSLFASGKESSLKGWADTIESHRFRIITAYVGKDVADRIIVRECAEISLERPDIDTFCIVSNDAGFAPICHLLRSWGKKVFVMGTAHAAKTLQNDFEFISLEASADIPPQTLKLMQLLNAAFIELNQEWVTLARLGETILKTDSDFKTEYSGMSLSKLLQTLPRFIELRKEQSQYSARLKNPITKNQAPKTKNQKLITKIRHLALDNHHHIIGKA